MVVTTSAGNSGAAGAEIGKKHEPGLNRCIGWPRAGALFPFEAPGPRGPEVSKARQAGRGGFRLGGHDGGLMAAHPFSATPSKERLGDVLVVSESSARTTPSRAT